MTTLEPGASEVLTQGLRFSPRSTAFLASSAAPTMTEGLDVLVQEVIAAITTLPWSTEVWVPSSSVTRAGRDALVPSPEATGSEAGNVPSRSLSRLESETEFGRASQKAVLSSASAIRSCGRFGPAIDGTTVDRPRLSSSQYLTSWCWACGSCQSPCSLAYASTRSSCSGGRPVSVR